MKTLLLLLFSVTAVAEHAVTPTPMPGNRAVAGPARTERPGLETRCEAVESVGRLSVDDQGRMTHRPDAEAPAQRETSLARAAGSPNRTVDFDDPSPSSLRIRTGAQSVSVKLPDNALERHAMRYAFSHDGSILVASSPEGTLQYAARINADGTEIQPWRRMNFHVPTRNGPQFGRGMDVQHLVVPDAGSVISINLAAREIDEENHVNELRFRRATPPGNFGWVRHEVTSILPLPVGWRMRPITIPPLTSPSGRYVTFALSAFDPITETGGSFICVSDLSILGDAERIAPNH